MRSKPYGKLIVIEGGEGSGKTTQAVRLVDWLKEEKGIKTFYSREPGGTPLGESIRRILLHKIEIDIIPISQILLFMADRAQTFERAIYPHRVDGTWVVMDRSYVSTYAYQTAESPQYENLILELGKRCFRGQKFDLLLYLDVNPFIGLGRLEGKKDRFEGRGLAFHSKVGLRYKEFLLSHNEKFPIKWVGAEKTPDEVFCEILEGIEETFPELCGGKES